MSPPNQSPNTLKCKKCKKNTSDKKSAKCECCESQFCGECAGLSATEGRVLELKAGRALSFLCPNCRGNVKLLPTLIKLVEELREEIRSLKKRQEAAETERTITEWQERKVRAKNIILYDAEESSSSDAEERKAHDIFKMHMFMWLGYNLGEFMFAGLNIVTKPTFAGTCIVLFIIAFLFEGSKLYVARAQRIATKKLCLHRRTDERRNLLWDAQPESRNAGPSRTTVNTRPAVSRTTRTLVNLHQTTLYLLHNIVGYLLMMAVMIYNVYLIIAVVLGMMAGYFVFGPMLTKLQMECPLKTKPHCTTECDDNAEGTTPPLLHTSLSSESDFFACETPSCSRPGESTPAMSSNPEISNTKNCYYGAKRCPSKVAVASRLQKEASPSHCHTDTEDNIVTEFKKVEDTMLLRDDSASCCANTTPPVALDPVVRIVNPETSCCSLNKQPITADNDTSHHSKDRDDITQMVTGDVLQENIVNDSSQHEVREESPQVSCCHNTKSTVSGSQEQIL